MSVGSLGASTVRTSGVSLITASKTSSIESFLFSPKWLGAKGLMSKGGNSPVVMSCPLLRLLSRFSSCVSGTLGGAVVSRGRNAGTERSVEGTLKSASSEVSGKPLSTSFFSFSEAIPLDSRANDRMSSISPREGGYSVELFQCFLPKKYNYEGTLSQMGWDFSYKPRHFAASVPLWPEC